MLNFFRRPKVQEQKPKLFSETFYKKKHHQWILESPKVKRVFDILLECISFEKKIDQKLANMNEVIFLPASGKLACSLENDKNSKFIIVFPDLFEMMFSASPIRAVAILAHELGHVYYGHATSKNNQSILESQLEADQFAANLGLAKELQEVLLDHNFDLDTKVRISHLTANYFSDYN